MCDHHVLACVGSVVDNISLTEYGNCGGSCCFKVIQGLYTTSGLWYSDKAVTVGPVSKYEFESLLEEVKNDIRNLKNDLDLERVLIYVEEDNDFKILLVRKETGYSLECVRTYEYLGLNGEPLMPGITITDIDNFERLFQQLIDLESEDEEEDDDDYEDKVMLLTESFDVLKL